MKNKNRFVERQGFYICSESNNLWKDFEQSLSNSEGWNCWKIAKIRAKMARSECSK